MRRQKTNDYYKSHCTETRNQARKECDGRLRCHHIGQVLQRATRQGGSFRYLERCLFNRNVFNALQVTLLLADRKASPRGPAESRGLDFVQDTLQLLGRLQEFTDLLFGLRYIEALPAQLLLLLFEG